MSREFNYMHFGKGTRRIALITRRKVCRSGCAGLLFSPLFPESVRIFVNDHRLESLGVRMGYLSVLPDGSDPVIFLTGEAFRALQRGSCAARFLILHEAGHYVCGHMNQPVQVADAHQRRFELIGMGRVAPEELEADRFAADYLGAEYAARALDCAMSERLQLDRRNGVCCHEVSIRALREFQMRIDAIRGQVACAVRPVA